MASFLKKKKYNLINDVLNNVLIYLRGIKTLRQNNVKVTKITFSGLFSLLKVVCINFLFLIQYIIYPLLKVLISFSTILFSILKIPIFIKKQIYKKYFDFIYSLYFYNLKNLFKKRNALLRMTTKSIVRYHKRKTYKEKYLNYLTTRLKMKFTKYGKRYFMRNVKKRKKFDSKLQKESALLTKYFYNYYSMENVFYKVENKITYNILHIFSKIEFILHNITKIVNYFNSYKKLDFIRHSLNLYLDKFRNIGVSINNRSVLLKLFRKIDETFHRLIIKRLYTVVHKRNKKRYIRHSFNLSILNSFLLVYFVFKITLIMNIIFNEKMVYFISNRLELLFSMQGIFKEYSRFFNLN